MSARLAGAHSSVAVIAVASVVAALAALAVSSPTARAQSKDPRRPDTGYVGSATNTDEVDRCKLDAGIGEDEARTRAREHFQRGVNLYGRGDYEAAIEEFVASYCHLSTHEALHNISQSFERLGEYEKAVAYLERYILEIPDDFNGIPGEGARQRAYLATRAEVLRRLPARIRVATVPAGANVKLTGENGVRADGLSTDGEPYRVPKGTYTLEISMPGFETITQTIEVEIGQPYSYLFQLNPKKGQIRVAVDPPDAEIFLRGESQDRRGFQEVAERVGTGNYVNALPIGRYEVSIEADGREPTSRVVEVTETRPASLTLALDPAPASGRRPLLIAAGIGGAAFGGGALAGIFQENNLVSALGGLLGLGVGLGSAYLGVPDDISVGTSSLIISSSLLGAAEGLLVASFLSCESVQNEVDGTFDAKNCNEGAITGAALAAGVGGMLLGAVAAEGLEVSAGDAALINSGALWGAITGGLFYAAFDQDARVDEPLVFAGLNLGVVTGVILARRFDLSRRHSALIDLSGLAGLVAGSAFADVIGQGTSESQPHFALVGMTGGLVIGAYLTRHMDEPKTLRNLGTNVGTAIDAGGARTPTLGIQGSF